MEKVILIFSVFWACFFPVTNLPEREDASYSDPKKVHRLYMIVYGGSDSKKVHKPKLIQESIADSVPRDHYALRLSGYADRSANLEMLQMRKVRFKSCFDVLGASR